MPNEESKRSRRKRREAEKVDRGGPKTPEGRAVSRLNAWRHGLASQLPVVSPVEREEDWEWLRAGVLEYLAPDGVLEEALAERIATTVWRLLRAVRYETESIQSYVSDVPRDWQTSRVLGKLPVAEKLTPEIVREMDRMLIGRLLPDEATLERVMRYETKHHRMLLQTLHQYLVIKGAAKAGLSYRGVPTLGAPGGNAPRATRASTRMLRPVKDEEEREKDGNDEDTRE